MSEPVAPSGAALFHGVSRWMMAPVRLAGGIGVVLAVASGACALNLPPGTLTPLLTCAAAMAAVVVLSGDVAQKRALMPVLSLERLGAAPSTSALRAAAKALFEFPDRAFVLLLTHWVIASLATGVSFAVWAKVDAWLAVQVVVVGAAIGPLTVVFAYLLALVRARAVISRLAQAGLSAQELIRTAPPKRMQLRTRWMTFTAICVLTPTFLVANLVLRRAETTLEVLGTHHTLSEQEAVVARQTSGDSAALAVAGLAVALVLVVAFMTGAAMETPLREMSREATRISSGDLRVASVIVGEDEVWAASAAFATMQSQLTVAITELKRAGIRIGSTTEELLASSRQHEGGSAEQATALTETSATTEELARSARQISGNAQTVAQMADQTLSAAQAGMASAESFNSSMGKTREGNQAIADSVVKLNKRVQQIGKIVEFINEIADKSDLLALNAELEGTKAGEVGRGFSLVAAEMRRLAESVMDSTREISRLINEIRDATNAAVMATEAGVKATDRGIALSTKMTESLEEILALARETSDAVRSISLATHQQQTGTDQLAEAMLDILQSTQQGTIATREVASANSDLSTLSRDLRTVVERFTLS